MILEAQRAQMQKLENGLLLSEETLDAKTKLLRDVQAESRRLREAVRLPSVPASPTAAGRGSVARAELMTQGCGGVVCIGKTLDGSFSAVSKPTVCRQIVNTKCSLECS